MIKHQTQPDSEAVYEVLGIPIWATTLDRTFNKLLSWSRDYTGRYVGVREVASVMAMRKDEKLITVAKAAHLNIPDGMPLVWMGQRLGHDVSRTCGPDLMAKVFVEGREHGLKHYLYGGKPGVADEIIANFTLKYPDIKFVGTHCPPFRDMTESELEDVINDINSSGANIVWVGISSPRQDLWMFENHTKTPATMIGVGAAFDFHSGRVKRAPKWMQKIGLEWLHRLCSEPRRLWKRYLILAPHFAAISAKDMVFKK